MNAAKRVTLRDVAEVTGVSAKTVSNVVNNSGWVSDPVRKRVLEAIAQLGYQPNLAARQLRKGTSRVVALILPTLREPYFAELASSFVQQARQMGVTVFITETNGSREQEQDAIEGRTLPGIDAIVCSPLALKSEDLDQRRSKLPLILLGEYASTFNSENFCFQIGYDNAAAASVATRHLLQLGAKNIAVIGYQDDDSQATSQLRYQGFLSAMKEAGLTPDPRLIGTVRSFNRREAALALDKIIESGVYFDGVLCFSDTIALGTISVLASNDATRDRQIPIVGFDNIEDAKYAYPVFDTIDPHMEIIAKTVLERLFANTEKSKYSPGQHIETPFEIIIRSVGKQEGSM